MSGPVYYSGIVNLLPGVTFSQIRTLYLEHVSSNHKEEQPSLDLVVEGKFYDLNDEVRWSVENEQFDYEVGMPDGSYTFVDEFDAFLDALAPLSLDGWGSTEGEPGDDQVVKYRGRSPYYAKKAELHDAQAEASAVVEKVARLQSELMRILDEQEAPAAG